VLVRPERVRPGGSADHVNEFAGTLTRDRFLGALRRFDLAAPGGIIVGETAEAGSIDRVHVRPEHVTILNDESPQRT
jgi:putative spermidine/putrescine transport system ATP-binding protein